MMPRLHLIWRLALGIVLLGSCSEPGVGDENCGESVALNILSYNLAQKSGLILGRLALQIEAASPDFVAVQECRFCDELLDTLPSRFAMSAQPRSGVTMIYDRELWALTHSKFITLGNNDDGWGERVLHWARFEHLESGHCLNTFSTHWCVPVRSPDDVCDVDQQLRYADKTLEISEEYASPRAPIVLAGDFNVFDGFEAGPVVKHLLGAGLVDVFREHLPAAEGSTFQGNSFAPAGRIDYIFASENVEILGALIDRETVPQGQGSDHFPVSARIQFDVP